MRLLIVDDEQQIRDGIEKGVCWDDYGVDEVCTAADGASAWRLFCAQPFDIIITDIRMPGMDGIELSKRILLANPQTSVMVMSGYQEFDYVYAAMKVGVDNFELKPVHEKTVTRFVRDAVKRIQEAAARSRRNEQYISALGEHILKQVFCGTPEERAAQLVPFREAFGEDSHDPHYLAVLQVTADPQYAEQISSFFERIAGHLRLVLRQRTVVAWRAELDRYALLVFPKNSGLSMLGIAPVLERAIDYANSSGDIQCAAVLLPTAERGSIAERYARALRLLAYKLYKGNAFFLCDDGTLPALQTEVYPFSDIAELKRAIALTDSSIADRLLEKEFDRIAARQTLDNVSVKNFCLDFLNTLRLSTVADCFGPGILLDVHFLRLFHVSRKETLQEYIQATRAQCSSLFAFIRKNSGSKRNIAVTQAVRYIHEHYAEGLTVETIAAYVKKSPNYFSQMFNMEMGVSIPEYIMRTRIAEAKKLIDLGDQNCLVYQIAEKVGYADYKYFSKIFRKSVGCSVSDYKNRANR